MHFQSLTPNLSFWLEHLNLSSLNLNKADCIFGVKILQNNSTKVLIPTQKWHFSFHIAHIKRMTTFWLEYLNISPSICTKLAYKAGLQILQNNPKKYLPQHKIALVFLYRLHWTYEEEKIVGKSDTLLLFHKAILSNSGSKICWIMLPSLTRAIWTKSWCRSCDLDGILSSRANVPDLSNW